MTIKKLLFIRQCDMKGCKRIANFNVMYDENNPRTTMCMCNTCLQDIAKCYKDITKTKKKGD